MKHLSLYIDGKDRVDFVSARLVIASWTGRDREHLQRQVAGLEAIGIKTPVSIPCFFNLSSMLLTTDQSIDVLGEEATGEVEAVLMHDATHGWLVGVGSDHTDREVERYDVAVAKQACAKPIGKDVWQYADVSDHWDALIARSWRVDASGERRLYQEGTLAHLLSPSDLIESAFNSADMPTGTALFCGTQPVKGQLCATAALEIELHDPVRHRSLNHRYSIETLVHLR